MEEKRKNSLVFEQFKQYCEQKQRSSIVPKPVKRALTIKEFGYERYKAALIEQANENFKNDEMLNLFYEGNPERIENFDFRRDYYLPDDFILMDRNELDLLNTKDEIQEFAMPFSNEQFKEFMTMPKIAIGTTSKKFIQMNNGSGKSMGYSQLMIGQDKNGKNCLFKFNVAVDEHDSSKFNLSLDMCVAGCKWVHLCRYDSFETGQSEGHRNWIVNGEITKDYQVVKAPHLHTQTEECQVYFSDKLSYTTAEFSSRLNNVKQNDPNNHFYKALQTFSNAFGIKTPLAALAEDYSKVSQQNRLNTFLFYGETNIFSVDEQDMIVEDLEQFNAVHNNANISGAKATQNQEERVL